ncbi:hypothetical protein LLG96_11465 [bacterium]|nr:hypothetical protein [bacterium]
MAREKNSGNEKKKKTGDSEYEGLLNEFANIFTDEEKESPGQSKDHDGLALSELLGEDLTIDTLTQGISVSEDDQGGYEEITKEFEDNGLGDFSESSPLSEIPVEEDEMRADEEAVEETVSDDNIEITGNPMEELDSIFGEQNGDGYKESAGESDFSVVSEEMAVDLNMKDSEESDDELASLFSALTSEDKQEVAEDSGSEFASVKELETVGNIGTSGESGGDYSSLLSEFDDEKDVQAADESTDDYASIIDDLENGKSDEAPEDTGEEEGAVPVEGDTGEFNFVGIDDDKEPEATAQEETAREDTDFMDIDLGLDEDTEETPVTEENPAVTVPSPEKEEDDFLGLSSVGTTKESGAGAPGGGSVSAEVLFDGIEMDFDDQIALVTRAELLLAQKKNQEAAELLKQVSQQKGVTHWVAKRLRLLNPQSEKK